MKKLLTGLLIIGLIAGAIAGFFWWRELQAQQSDAEILRTAEIRRGDLEITVPASGSVAVNEKRDLFFSATGVVAEVLAARDSRVASGEVLARLDTTALQRSVRQAEIALEQARLDLTRLMQPPDEAQVELARLGRQSAAQALEVARIGQQTAGVDANALLVQAQRDREQAHRDLVAAEGTPGEERARTAYHNALEQEHIAQLNAETLREQAQEQWMAASTRFRQAEQALTRLEDGPTANQIRQMELQVEQARLNLEQAEARLADAELVAPFAGVLAAVNLQAGVPAPAATPAAILVDDSVFYVDVTVDEIEIGQVSVGQFVEIVLDAHPDSLLSGAVEVIAPAATTVGGVISYRLRVAFIDTGDIALRDGMTASVLIRTREMPDVLLIPNWAIRTDRTAGTFYTYVVTGETFRQQPITIGARSETDTEVLSGVQAGDVVALVTEERVFLPQGQ